MVTKLFSNIKVNGINCYLKTKIFIIKNKKIILLLVILLIGSVLRFNGANWGLPFRLHPDEQIIVDNAINMANAHRFEVTGDFNRPDHVPIKIQTLTFWTMRHFITAFSIVKLPLDIVIADISQFDGIPKVMHKLPIKAQLFLLNCYNNHKLIFNNENDDSLYVSAGRAISAMFGVISIFFAYLIGKQIHEDAGIICALLFSLYPNFIKHSHYITPETYLTTFILAITYFAIIYVKNQKFRTLFLMCFCAALAFCTKYPALFSFPIVIISIICSNLLNSIKQIVKNSFFNIFFKISGICVIALFTFGICAFFISPILFLDLSNVFVNVMYEARSTHLGADGLGFSGKLAFYLKCYLNHSGIIISTFTVFGFIFLYKKNRAIFVVLLSGMLYVLFISKLGMHWDRWGVPFYAFSLIFASIGMWKIFNYLKYIYRISCKNKKTRDVQEVKFTPPPPPLFLYLIITYGGCIINIIIVESYNCFCSRDSVLCSS